MKNKQLSVGEQNLSISKFSEEDKKLYEAYKEYSKDWCEHNENEKESILWPKINKLNNRNSLRYFLFAKHYYRKENNIDKTMHYIEKAIDRFSDNIPLLVETTKGVYLRNLEFSYLQSIKDEIYILGGEVCSISDNVGKSEKFYQFYHYMQSFLKSDFYSAKWAFALI